MAWVAVASATIAATGAIVAGNSAAKGAKQAAATEAAASDRAAQLANDAQLRLEDRMSPYIATGQAADSYINSFLGLPQAPQAPQAPGPGIGGQPMNEAQLRAKYPQEAAQWDGWERAGNSRTNGHRTIYGDFAGFIARTKGAEALQADPPPAPAPSPANDAQIRQTAQQAYEQSPWAKFAKESTDAARAKADQSFMSTAGARGALVSGRTAAGLYDIAQTAEDERFRQGFTEGYYPSLTGASTRGYNAAVGVGDSSLTTAANIGAAGERAADARANGQRDAADARASGVNSALYYLGQGADAVLNRPKTTPAPPAVVRPSDRPSKQGAASAGKYTGG